MIYKRTKIIRYEGIDVNLTVTFELHDDCHNGVCHFGITAEGVVARGKHTGPRKGRWLFGGCQHELVAKHFKELVPFIPLHLSNEFGQPSYPVDNFIFNIQQNEPDENLKEWYRVNDEQLAKLKTVTSHKEYFQYKLFKLGVIDKWKRDADVAIAWLEEKTGQKFTHTSNPRFTLEYSEEWMADIEKREAAGEFSEETLMKQKAEAHKKWQGEQLVKLAKEREFDTRKNELAEWLILNCPTENYSFFAYNGFGYRENPEYKLTLNAYNWRPKLTQEQIDEFVNRPDFPGDIIIKLEEK